jgi:hypothetical protein
MGTVRARAGCRNSVPGRRGPRALDIGEESPPETWEPPVVPVPQRRPAPEREPIEVPLPTTIPA